MISDYRGRLYDLLLNISVFQEKKKRVDDNTLESVLDFSFNFYQYSQT